jgi:hypothetical protein
MPDTINLGELLEFEPRQVAAGIPFAMLELDDDHLLQLNYGSEFAGKPPLSSLRELYLTYFENNDMEVVNDGTHVGYDDTFARQGHLLRAIIQRRVYPLTITAEDRSKVQGDTLTLDVNDVTVVGLQDADTVSSITITSSGTGSGAAQGAYDIDISAAIISPSTHQPRYEITYIPGTLTVTAPEFDVHFDIHYSESTNPSNEVASDTEETDTWDTSGTYSDTKTSGNIGDPFGKGSSGEGSCTIQIQKTSATNIRMTATIQSMGQTMEILLDSATQIQNISVSDFEAGNSTIFSWTANYFGGAFIGLVMFFELTVRKN